MDDHLLPECPLCGEHHEPSEPILGLLAAKVPVVRGSRMRHGGSFTTETGLTIGTDEWRTFRCVFCGREAMTPIEMIMPGSMQASDGSYLGHCGECDLDLRAGYRPGHNPERRRRRRR